MTFVSGNDNFSGGTPFRSQRIVRDSHPKAEPLFAGKSRIRSRKPKFRILTLMTAVLTLVAAANLSSAQAPRSSGSPATPEPLWAGGAPMAQGTADDDQPTLTAYLPAANPTRTAVIIAPGGGYAHLSMQKEGSDIAAWLNGHGIAGFVLKYRLGPKYRYPVELGDAQRAIRTVRAHAAEYGVAPDRIGIWGFSAGGHLAAMTGTLFDQGPKFGSPAPDSIDAQSARPDFLILAYPVITMAESFVHAGSRTFLLAPSDQTPAMLAQTSPEKHVSAQTPPTFLFATTDDPVVPVMNSVAFYSALISNKVPAEMHLFAHGPHGVGLAPGFPDLKIWPDLLAAWMRARGLMAPPTP
jgi:acetyl esterase/lipase